MIELGHPVKESALRRSLEQGFLVAITPRGGSMKPLIRDGERIFVAREKYLEKDDIVLAATGSGLIAHRLVGFENQSVLLKGDAIPGKPEEVQTASVFGRVVAVEKGGRMLDLRSRAGRAFSRRLGRLSRSSAHPASEALSLVPRGLRPRLQSSFFTGIYQVPYTFFNWWAHAASRGAQPLPAEYRLVMSACRSLGAGGAGKPGPGIAGMLGCLDWELVFNILRMHQFTPAFYHAARINGWLEEMPRDAALRLGAEYRTNLARNMVLLEEARELIRTLSRAGVAAIPIQGISMLSKLYGDDPGIRPLGDVDILVRQRDLEAARTVLAQSGYRELAGNAARNAEAFETGTTFRKKAGMPGVPVFDVELHYWEPLGKTFLGKLFRFDPAGVWERIQKGGFEGEQAFFLDPVDELIFHIVHTVASHQVGRLIWYLDLTRHLKEFGDSFPWDEFGRRSRRMHTGRVVALAFELQKLYFGNAPPVGFDLLMDPTSRAWLRAFSSPRVFLLSKYSDRQRSTSIERFVAKALLLFALAERPLDRKRFCESLCRARAKEKEYFYGRLGPVAKITSFSLHRLSVCMARRILTHIYTRGPDRFIRT
jgi:hypothetical protein